MCLPSGTDAKLLPRRLLENSCTQTVETWGQCGGKTCPDGSGSNCNDEAYNCCPSDNSCERQNEWYWQCLPRTSGTFYQLPMKPVSSRSPDCFFGCKALLIVHVEEHTQRRTTCTAGFEACWLASPDNLIYDASIDAGSLCIVGVVQHHPSRQAHVCLHHIKICAMPCVFRATSYHLGFNAL